MEQQFYTVEVNAPTEREAMEKALAEVQKDPSYYLTGMAKGITGVFINDREARDFSSFVPEALPSENASE